MTRTRDYKSEYRARVARAAARGLTRSQARGHARPGETPIRQGTAGASADPRLEHALKSLRQVGSQSAAARSAGISVERFRRFLGENKLAHREGRTWKLTDNRIREVRLISDGRSHQVSVAGFEGASIVGRYNEAVRAFLETNDISRLDPFVGISIRDAKGKRHQLETRPNTLYRLAASGTEGFEQVYRLVN